MTPTCKEEIIHIIENLPNKASSGFDNLNNLILKSLKHEIVMPLEKYLIYHLKQVPFLL